VGTLPAWPGLPGPHGRSLPVRSRSASPLLLASIVGGAGDHLSTPAHGGPRVGQEIAVPSHPHQATPRTTLSTRVAPPMMIPAIAIPPLFARPSLAALRPITPAMIAASATAWLSTGTRHTTRHAIPRPTAQPPAAFWYSRIGG